MSELLHNGNATGQTGLLIVLTSDREDLPERDAKRTGAFADFLKEALRAGGVECANALGTGWFKNSFYMVDTPHVEKAKIAVREMVQEFAGASRFWIFGGIDGARDLGELALSEHALIITVMRAALAGQGWINAQLTVENEKGILSLKAEVRALRRKLDELGGEGEQWKKGGRE